MPLNNLRVTVATNGLSKTEKKVTNSTATPTNSCVKIYYECTLYIITFNNNLFTCLCALKCMQCNVKLYLHDKDMVLPSQSKLPSMLFTNSTYTTQKEFKIMTSNTQRSVQDDTTQITGWRLPKGSSVHSFFYHHQ